MGGGASKGFETADADVAETASEVNHRFFYKDPETPKSDAGEPLPFPVSEPTISATVNKIDVKKVSIIGSPPAIPDCRSL